jgi:hypothetical protein
VNQPACHLESEKAEQPEHQKNHKNRPDHDSSFSIRQGPGAGALRSSLLRRPGRRVPRARGRTRGARTVARQLSFWCHPRAEGSGDPSLRSGR